MPEKNLQVKRNTSQMIWFLLSIIKGLRHLGPSVWQIDSKASVLRVQSADQTLASRVRDPEFGQYRSSIQ